MFNQQKKYIQTSKSYNLSKLASAQSLKKKCWEKYYQILRYAQLQTADNIIDIIDIFKKDTHIQESVRYSNFIKKPLFIPLCLKKGQQEYVEGLLASFRQKLYILNEKKQKINSLKPKRDYSGISTARKVNIFQSDQYINLSKIVLLMYHNIQQIHQDGDLSIFITNNDIEYNQVQINFMQKLLAKSDCIIIAPTFQEPTQNLMKKILIQSQQREKNSQIIPVRLFEPKNLFCELMYSCIIDSQIKAYLPKQSIKLLNDFDNHQITYKQGTARLINVIHQLQVFRKTRNILFKYVQIKKLVQTIEAALQRNFKFFNDKFWNKEQYVKFILDQAHVFNILDKYTNKNSYFGRQQQGFLTQSQLMLKVRKTLIRYIERDESIKHFSSFFKQNIESMNAMNDLDQKHILLSQIKKAICNCTSDIKEQANLFKWGQYADKIVGLETK